MKLTIEGHQVQMSPVLNERVEASLDGIFEKSNVFRINIQL